MNSLANIDTLKKHDVFLVQMNVMMPFIINLLEVYPLKIWNTLLHCAIYSQFNYIGYIDKGRIGINSVVHVEKK